MGCLHCHTLALVTGHGCLFRRVFPSAQSSAPQGSPQRVGLGVLHTACPGLPLCCAGVLLGVLKSGAKHAGTTQTIPGLCVLPQKSLIPLVTPVNLFPQQTCTGTCSCPKETCGRTSVSERLSNSVHNCRDMSIISNSLQKRKAFLLSIRPCGNRNWPSCANLVDVIDSSFHTDFQAKVISKS